MPRFLFCELRQLERERGLCSRIPSYTVGHIICGHCKFNSNCLLVTVSPTVGHPYGALAPKLASLYLDWQPTTVCFLSVGLPRKNWQSVSPDACFTSVWLNLEETVVLEQSPLWLACSFFLLFFFPLKLKQHNVYRFVQKVHWCLWTKVAGGQTCCSGKAGIMAASIFCFCPIEQSQARGIIAALH